MIAARRAVSFAWCALAAALAVGLAVARATAPDPAPPRPEAIDRLLAEARWAEALEACAAASADPGRRDLAQLLWQHGVALERTGRPRDASVMYLRLAIVFPAAPQVPEALLAAAEIVRSDFGDAAGGWRLLRRAADAAAVLGDADAGRNAEALRARWTDADRRR